MTEMQTYESRAFWHHVLEEELERAGEDKQRRAEAHARFFVHLAVMKTNA